MAFNPNEHLTDLKGSDYLEVKWRLVWFREEHPKGTITTELIASEPTVIMRAVVSTDAGVLSTGYGTAPAAGKGQWTGRGLEKAETAAIGRALAHAGYGTQFAPEDDELDHLADAPVKPAQKATTPPIQPVQAQSTTPAKTSAADAEFDDLPRPEWAGWTQDLAQELAKWAIAEYKVDNPTILKVLNVSRVGQYKGTFTDAQAAISTHALAAVKF